MALAQFFLEFHEVWKEPSWEQELPLLVEWCRGQSFGPGNGRANGMGWDRVRQVCNSTVTCKEKLHPLLIPEGRQGKRDGITQGQFWRLQRSCTSPLVAAGPLWPPEAGAAPSGV